MKKIDLSNISTSVGMPIKSGVLSHLQSAYQEVIDAIVKGSIGGSYDPAKYYVLYGCENSTTAPIYTVSAGAIFFNGEVYLVDAFTFTSSGSDVAVGTITTTFFSGANADPITFTDSVARNVLQIRKVAFASAVSGSGDVDFGDLVQNFVYTASSNSARFHITDGTASFGGYQFFYKRINGIIYLSFAINITPATYSSGKLQFYLDMTDLPLPDTAYNIGTDEIAATCVSFYGVASSNNNLASVYILKNSSLDIFDYRFYVKINNSTTSSIFITGQIFYKEI
jgi:hypothetical protein